MFRNRSTVDLMALAFTAAVVLAVLAGGCTLAVVEIRNPAHDNSAVEEHLFNLLSTMLGALLGLLTGKAIERHDDVNQTAGSSDKSRSEGTNTGG